MRIQLDEEAARVAREIEKRHGAAPGAYRNIVEAAGSPPDKKWARFLAGDGALMVAAYRMQGRHGEVGAALDNLPAPSAEELRATGRLLSAAEVLTVKACRLVRDVDDAEMLRRRHALRDAETQGSGPPITSSGARLSAQEKQTIEEVAAATGRKPPAVEADYITFRDTVVPSLTAGERRTVRDLAAAQRRSEDDVARDLLESKARLVARRTR